MHANNGDFPSNAHYYIPLLDDEFDDLAVVNTPPQLPDLVMSPRADVAAWFE